ncbi:MAG TPA: TadE/TadG family type IV pilus assembly protein [Phycisphaerae bacterium]|nr:TadE/TadG family type IV pilus assembly protein [Phycisphaerae bacterium]
MQCARNIFGPKTSRRGTAMIETVFCIPLFALLLLGVFFLGWAMRCEQKLIIASRYAAWRTAANREVYADAWKTAWINYGEPDEEESRNQFVDDYETRNKIEPTAAYLNERFFTGTGSDTTISTGGWPNDVLEEYVSDARNEDTDAGDLADRTALGDFPSGSGAKVASQFEHDYDLYLRFTHGDTVMDRSHYIDATSWRRWQTSLQEPMRVLFLNEWDETVKTVEPQALQTSLEEMYSQDW